MVAFTGARTTSRVYPIAIRHGHKAFGTFLRTRRACLQRSSDAHIDYLQMDPSNSAATKLVGWFDRKTVGNVLSCRCKL